MNKNLKIIIIVSLSIIGFHYISFLGERLIYGHSLNEGIYKQYMWAFKDSIKQDIDTNYCVSCVTKKDVYNSFLYKKNYVTVWEFKDLGSAELNKMNIKQNINLDDIKFNSGEILNKGGDLEINIKYGFAFKNAMTVNVDDLSKIQRTFEGANYKGFYGSINKMSLSDEKGKPQIVLNYTKGLTPTVFLLYKGHQSFYLIMINPIDTKKPFDENIINIFNLDLKNFSNNFSEKFGITDC
jgi:hypothetical protein